MYHSIWIKENIQELSEAEKIIVLTDYQEAFENGAALTKALTEARGLTGEYYISTTLEICHQWLDKLPRSATTVDGFAHGFGRPGVILIRHENGTSDNLIDLINERHDGFDAIQSEYVSE
jgi:hypothetical protein